MTPQHPKNKTPNPHSEGGKFKDEAGDAVDVNGIHRRVVEREMKEPDEGFEPTPWWLWTVSVILLFVMGFYLGRYSGSFSSVAHEVEEPIVAGGQPVAREVKGSAVYAGVCQACHQVNGLGVAGQYPPLVGSEWLLQDSETPIRIVLHGLAGEMNVKGQTYNNKMPQFLDKLSNEEIAAALTHERTSWGNKGPAVTPAEVDSIRRQTSGRGPYSAAELEALRKSTKPQR
jgi:mono/diheme cytochrome c family protein